MTLTPSQIGMRMMLGYNLPNLKYRDTRELVLSGRQELSRITGQDFRYDVVKWHEYLVSTNDGGYTFDDGHERLHEMILESLDSEEWSSVVTELGAEADSVVFSVQYQPLPEDASKSKFRLKDRVKVLSNNGKNTEKEGQVCQLTWHHKNSAWCYYIEINKIPLKKRYFEEDLELQ